MLLIMDQQFFRSTCGPKLIVGQINCIHSLSWKTIYCQHVTKTFLSLTILQIFSLHPQISIVLFLRKRQAPVEKIIVKLRVLEACQTDISAKLISHLILTFPKEGVYRLYQLVDENFMWVYIFSNIITSKTHKISTKENLNVSWMR
jgi:hypothetical protein